MLLLILIIILYANGLIVPASVYVLCTVRIILQGIFNLASIGEGK